VISLSSHLLLSEYHLQHSNLLQASVSLLFILNIKKKKFLTKLQYFVVVIILVVGISRPTPAKKKMICMFLFFDRIYTIRNTQVAATEVKSNGSERHATKAGQFTRFSE
jgi:hypothetical protein